MNTEEVKLDLTIIEAREIEEEKEGRRKMHKKTYKISKQIVLDVVSGKTADC